MPRYLDETSRRFTRLRAGLLAATLAFAATPVGAQSNDGLPFNGAQRARASIPSFVPARRERSSASAPNIAFARLAPRPTRSARRDHGLSNRAERFRLVRKHYRRERARARAGLRRLARCGEHDPHRPPHPRPWEAPAVGAQPLPQHVLNVRRRRLSPDPNLALAPTISLQYDRASGDHNPTDDRNERFNTLFGARRFDFGPTGIYGLAFRSNLETPGVRLTLKPAERWQTMFAYRSFRLAAARDVWVGSGYADPTGAAGKSIGRQLEGDFSVEILPNRLSIEAGAAYDRAGRFARTTAGADFLGNPWYFYAAVTTRF
jgi:hypothetical protein